MLALSVNPPAAMARLLSAPRDSAAGLLLTERPQILASWIWPYQNATWTPEERLDRIADHCRELDAIGTPLIFSTEERLVLADLEARHPGLRLVLDQPRWFIREGGLTLNLFVGSFRAYSLAFSLFRDEDGRRGAYIGALQGRNTDDALDLYRDLTRALYGMRPRDFLIDCLRVLAGPLEIEALRAVGDAARHHRHPFFQAKDLDESQDYDAIWAERGGTVRADGDFDLPVDPVHRPLEEIKAKKRSLYRQRYAFMDDLAMSLPETLKQVRPVRFKDS